MTRPRFLLVLVALVVAAGALPRDAGAIPVFARKYGVACTMCHTAYPRLNDLGVRFRDHGYRLPGRGDPEPTVLDSPPPLALRTGAGYVYEETRHVATPEKRAGFELTGLDLLSGGLLGRRIGYFLVYVPGIAEQRGVAGQDAELEMANLVFSELGGAPVSVRAGRYEPEFAAFSPKRHLGDAPYEVYEYSFPGGPTLAGTQTGLEVRYGGPRVRATAGLVEGSPTNRAADPPQDAYVRLESVIGAGEGQTAGQRVGVVGYLGRARPDAAVGAPTDDLQGFDRIGVDASLNARGVNLALQYLWGRDDAALWGQPEEATWNGGFAELTVLPNARSALLARVEQVSEPSFVDQDIRRYTAGGRWYLEGNVAAHLEWSHQVVSSPATDDALADYVTLRLDAAF